MTRWRAAIIALCTLAGLLLGVLVILDVPGVTGPSFWAWPYRYLPAWPTYAALAVAAVPFFIGQVIYGARDRGRAYTLVALACVTLGCLALKLASVLPYTDPPGLGFIQTIVENPDATSYYTDAAALRSAHPEGWRGWLPLYPQYMPQLSLHSKTKAPGPVLYWTVVIHFFGVGRTAAIAGGIGVGVLAALAIPVTYVFLRALTRDGEAAFAGASFMSLCPGFVLFFPMFDPAYAILSCAMIGLWAAAVERDDWRAAAGAGAALAAVCWVSFNVLVVGAFMAAYPFVVARAPFARTAKLAAIALVTGFALLALSLATFGYDPAATFASAWRNQQELLARFGYMRPYPRTIPFDLLDFAFGAAWSGAALAIAYFADRTARAEERLTRLSLLCLAQLVLVAVTGLLQMETARVWNFMLPLLMVPAGIELRAWAPRWRALVYLAAWFAMAAIAQNVKLIY